MNLSIKPSLLFQHILSLAAILFGVLTQAMSTIHLPPTASLILGAFGILLHPQTSITQTTTPPNKGTPQL